MASRFFTMKPQSYYLFCMPFCECASTLGAIYDCHGPRRDLLPNYACSDFIHLIVRFLRHFLNLYFNARVLSPITIHIHTHTPLCVCARASVCVLNSTISHSRTRSHTHTRARAFTIQNTQHMSGHNHNNNNV